MPDVDILLLRAKGHEQKHDEKDLQIDLMQIWHRDSHIADPQARQWKVESDMSALRDIGISEQRMKALGFPDTAHMVYVFDKIADDQKEDTRADLPVLKLDEKEKQLVGSMDRAIVEGDYSRLDHIAGDLEDDPLKFQKLAAFVRSDMKQIGVDVSTQLQTEFGYTGIKQYVDMQVNFHDKDGSTTGYGLSTKDIWYPGEARAAGRIVSEAIASEVAKKI